MEAGLRDGVVSYWLELRAVEIVVKEIREEFEGEDPLRPVIRDVVEQTRKDLTTLHSFFALREPLELPEPDAETLDQVREFMAKGHGLST